MLNRSREVGGTEWLEIVIENTSCGEGERELVIGLLAELKYHLKLVSNDQYWSQPTRRCDFLWHGLVLFGFKVKAGNCLPLDHGFCQVVP